MKKFVLKSFIIYFILSIFLNLLIIILFDKKASFLTMDLFHFIPALIFNEYFIELIFRPPDILFLFPIAFTDAVSGGLIGLLLQIIFKNKVSYLYIIMSFIVFQFVIFTCVPIFKP